MNMKTEHKYAQVLRWIADGETVEVKRNRGEWVSLPSEISNRILRSIADGNCVSTSEFRLKPRAIAVNGREIVPGEKVDLKKGDGYFIPNLRDPEFYGCSTWDSHAEDLRLLELGLIHLNKENAIAHAKAMLGID